MNKMLQKNKEFDIVVTCASGVEKVVKSELVRLGYPSSPAINGAITFSGDLQAVARCNVNLRCADRVYVKLAEFTATSFDQLFDGVYDIEWSSILPKNAKIVVDGKCVKSKLFAISACQSIIKKAIISRLSKCYKNTLFNENGALYNVEFSIYKDQATIMLNTSGAGLHKRGYRDLVGIAPIKETLASALLLMSDFYYEKPFIDPFCGSGTFVIEGAKIALNIAPNLQRKFAFSEWDGFDEKCLKLAIEEAKDKEIRDRKIDFCGFDVDSKTVALAKRHAQRAGVLDKLNFSCQGVEKLVLTKPKGTIVTNPPYGERVYDVKQAEECYRQLGKALKDNDRWSAFVITKSKSFERYFGKKADRYRKLFNSNIECKYYFYYGKKGEI